MYKCKEPKFINFEETMIDVIWEHPDHGDIPFTASPDDCEAHGREIFSLAKEGKFGEVSPYDGPAESELLAVEVRGERDRLLRELDVVVGNPLRYSEFSEEIKLELATYRQALLDVPQQEGFPDAVDWPSKPWFL